MSLSFNDGGLVTRGMGTDNKMTTRGFGKKFEFGGISRPRKIKEYFFDIFMPISKENYQELDVYSPLEVEKRRKLNLISNVSKEIQEELGILAVIDHSKLAKILEEL